MVQKDVEISGGIKFGRRRETTQDRCRKTDSKDTNETENGEVW